MDNVGNRLESSAYPEKPSAVISITLKPSNIPVYSFFLVGSSVLKYSHRDATDAFPDSSAILLKSISITFGEVSIISSVLSSVEAVSVSEADTFLSASGSFVWEVADELFDAM